MRIAYEHKAAEVLLEVTPTGEHLEIVLAGGEGVRAVARALDSRLIEIEEGNRRYRVAIARSKGRIRICHDGRVYEFAAAKAGGGSTRTQPRGGLTAPMTGAIVEVMVKEGQRVQAYQPMIVIEAMKVLATVEAPFSGVVEKIYAAKGDQVDHDQLLLDLSPAT